MIRNCARANPAAASTLRRSPEIACADNLAFMRTLPDAHCDLIYADPPFDQPRKRGSSDWNKAGGKPRSFVDIEPFLEFMRPRLEETRRILSSRGSLYLHLDWRTAHYVKVMLDEVFGRAAFLNEIIWSYRGGSRLGRWFARKHDTILVYAKSKGSHTFNQIRGGSYRTRDMLFDDAGRPYKSTRRGRIYFNPDGPALTDVWDLPILSTVSRERTGYRCQKPEALLERMIRAASNEGDLVADFFCGSGTTLAVAKRLNRRILGCDINPEAIAVTQERLFPACDSSNRENLRRMNTR